MPYELSEKFKSNYPKQEHKSPHLDIDFLVKRDTAMLDADHVPGIGIAGRGSIGSQCRPILEALERLNPVNGDKILFLPAQGSYDIPS